MPKNDVPLTAIEAHSRFGVTISQRERTSSSAQTIAYGVRYRDATAVLPHPIERLQQAAEDTAQREHADQ
jgi:hypothetical protein